jgi:hypothetical protein
MSCIAKLVPNFAARWRLFCNNFFTPEINNKMEQTKATWVYRNHSFTPQKENPNYKENPVTSNKKIQTTLR